MQPREIFDEFNKVDTFDHPSIDLLIKAYASLGAPDNQNAFKSYRNRLLERASIAAEISIHPDASIARKRRYGERAHSLLMAQSVNGHFISGDIYTEPLRAHLSLYNAMPSFENLPQDLARSLFRITDNYESEDFSTRLGFACEVASSMICNGMQRFGLKSYPAFVRQDNGNSAELNKNFDLIVESDGSTIKAGRYPVQVKATKNSSKVRYHPAISKISFDKLTEYDLSDLKGSMGDLALRSLVTYDSSTQFKLHTPEQIGERLLESLEDTGPLDQEMLLTESVMKITTIPLYDIKDNS